MKERKYIPLILLLILLLVSVGYALLSTTLNINGTSKIAATSWDIHFENVQTTSNSNVTPTTAPSAPIGNKPIVITYDVSLVNPGDTYEFTVDVVNAGTLDSIIEDYTSTIKVGEGSKEIVSPSTIPSYLNYYVEYSDGTAIEQDHVLDAGNRETIKVSVGLKNDITLEQLQQIEGTTIYLEVGMTYKQK